MDARLDAQIGAGGVLMYSFTSCPFCKKAKELLDAKQVSGRGLPDRGSTHGERAWLSGEQWRGNKATGRQAARCCQV